MIALDLLRSDYVCGLSVVFLCLSVFQRCWGVAGRGFPGGLSWCWSHTPAAYWDAAARQKPWSAKLFCQPDVVHGLLVHTRVSLVCLCLLWFNVAFSRLLRWSLHSSILCTTTQPPAPLPPACSTWITQRCRAFYLLRRELLRPPPAEPPAHPSVLLYLQLLIVL